MRRINSASSLRSDCVCTDSLMEPLQTGPASCLRNLKACNDFIQTRRCFLGGPFRLSPPTNDQSFERLLRNWSLAEFPLLPRWGALSRGWKRGSAQTVCRKMCPEDHIVKLAVCWLRIFQSHKVRTEYFIPVE